MTLYLRGTQDERACGGQGCDDCPYQATAVPDVACELEHGMRYIYHAADLWSLIDVEKARKVRSWIEDEWGSDPDGDPDIRCYGAGSCRYLLDLIDGLEDALRREVTDGDLRLPTASAVLQSHPHLIDSWPTATGDVYTLANRVQEVRMLAALLATAVRTDRDMCSD